MKKTLCATLATTTLLTCMGYVTINASAATQDGGLQRSKATIEYIENTDTELPDNPLAPGNSLKPSDDNKTGGAGPLSIDYVSDIAFGQNKTSGKTEIYKAELDTFKDGTKAPISAQVTDKRGSNAGWTLTAKQESLFKQSKGNEVLKGTILRLNNPNLSSKDNMTSGIPNSNVLPTVQAVKLSAKDSGEAGNEQIVATAAKDKGMGQWVTRYGIDNDEAKESVTLEVPGNSKKVKDTYSTSILWTLTDSPTS